MSKIICDVCGTSYPETVEQCPICGCVRPVDVQGVLSDAENADGKTGYTYVKGGRFSKSNVKKRVKSAPMPAYIESDDNDDSYEDDIPSDGRKGLIATALILLLAIIAVVIYITIRFFNLGGTDVDSLHNNSTTEAYQTVVNCVDLKISDEAVTFGQSGDAWMLNVQKLPADTTDALSCSAADETVASAIVTSSDKVKITAVGPGSTTVNIVCGEQVISCQVICNFKVSDTDTTEQNTESENDGQYTEKDIIFNSRYNPPEATLRSEGETWNCYKGKIPVEQITWKSDDESVATVKDGIVTAVGSGKTDIHAIWGEYDLTCTVRCNFITTSTGIPGSDDVGET